MLDGGRFEAKGYRTVLVLIKISLLENRQTCARKEKSKDREHVCSAAQFSGSVLTRDGTFPHDESQ